MLYTAPQREPVKDSSSGESLAAHLAAATRKSNGVWSRPLYTAASAARPQSVSTGSENEGSIWDDDFAEAPDVERFEKGRSA